MFFESEQPYSGLVCCIVLLFHVVPIVLADTAQVCEINECESQSRRHSQQGHLPQGRILGLTCKKTELKSFRAPLQGTADFR